MADNQSVMGSEPAAVPTLPELRPAGTGPLAWALVRVAVRPGFTYGVLMVAVAAGLVGSAALVGHAVNAPFLRAYQQGHACGIRGASLPDCLVFLPGTVLGDRRYPLGLHAMTVSVDGQRLVYYGVAERDHPAGARPGADALLVSWRGRTARVIAQGVTVEPFDGPPGAGFLLIVLAIACELLCAGALWLQSAGLSLRARVVSLPAIRGRAAPGAVRLQLVFVLLLAALLAGRTGHAAVAAPVHAAAGLAGAALLGAAGLGAGRSLVALAGRGLDGLSDEPALRLGGDVALAAVLVGLCLSLASDLVVNDLLTLPR
jgi:hypothetical protein